MLHPTTASVLSELGTIYAAQRKYKSALLVVVMAMVPQSERLGDNHPAAIRSKCDMATILRQSGQYDRALRIYWAAFTDTENNLSYAMESRDYGFAIDFPDSVNIVREMGMTYILMGDYERAERALSRSADYCEKNLGPEHSEALKTATYRAWLYYKQEKYKLSGELYLWLLGSNKYKHRMDVTDIALARYGLARILHKQRNYELAETLYCNTMFIYDNEAGGSVAYPPDLEKNFAALLHERGRHEEAEAVEARALPPYDWNKDEGDRELDSYFMQWFVGMGQRQQGLPERAVQDPFTKVKFTAEQIPKVETDFLEGLFRALSKYSTPHAEDALVAGDEPSV